MENFLGHNFVWFLGIVENNNDPLKIQRLQVRIFGIHSDNKQLIPTKNLPWCQVSTGINSDNFGTAKNGDQVWGFFLDGDNKQFPIVIGVIPAIPDSKNNNKSGFSDSRTQEQLNNAPSKPSKIEFNLDGSGATITNSIANTYPLHLNEPETSRLSRNDKIDETIIGTLQNNTIENVTGSDNTKWSEPKFQYSGKYPNIKGVESESGHALLLDDGKDSESVSLIHRTGTHLQYQSDGSKVEKIVKDNYEIVYGNDYVNIMGKCILNINGATEININSNCKLKINGNYNIDASGMMNFKASQFNFDGLIISTKDAIINGISVDTHGHTFVMSGNDISGPPIGSTGTSESDSVMAGQILSEYTS